MTTDNAWLNRNWPRIKMATDWLIAKDADADGLIASNQHNTLDTDWFGPVAWLSGLYLAALLAAAEMADLVGDARFAAKCRGIMKNGSFQGQQEVAIDAIRGSESRQKEFDDRFNPLSEQIRQRWQSIARAIEQGVSLPPVELVQVGKVYFVRDGHHRVSVARALGWKTILARVTVWNG